MALTSHPRTLQSGKSGGMGDVDKLKPEVAALREDERFALMQLCSTAYLACGRLSDTACTALAALGFAWKDRDGFWSATDMGRHIFWHLNEDVSSG